MKIIICGLTLGGLLGYSAYMVRCWFHSLPIYWPVNILTVLLNTIRLTGVSIAFSFPHFIWLSSFCLQFTVLMI